MAIASGPGKYIGPSGAVGANEMWYLSINVPPTEVAWVLVVCDYTVWAKTTIAPVASYFLASGSTSYASAIAPLTGLGSNLTTLSGAAQGTYVDQVAADVPPVRLHWCPLDPQYTVDGFDPIFYHQAPAGGLAADDLVIRAGSVRFLGFPVNAWETGVLWDPPSVRGS